MGSVGSRPSWRNRETESKRKSEREPAVGTLHEARDSSPSFFISLSLSSCHLSFYQYLYN